MFAASSKLQQNVDKYFTVLKVFREEVQSGKQIYALSDDADRITIFDKSGKKIDVIARSAIASKTAEMFQKISESNERTFSIPVGLKMLKKLYCSQIKANNQSKSDIVLMISDRISATTPTLGFSIKSHVGSPPTLLNASGATNFVYKIQGNPVQASLVNGIEGASKVKKRIKKI